MSDVVRYSVLPEKSAARRRQRGFTLIELSIVLTIIGLIVGGILKGQELINSARLKTQIAQIDAIKSATYTFQDKYSYLPGDYNAANPNLGFTSTANGNGDGQISPVADNADVGGESSMAWAHLDAANLIAGVTWNTATTALLTGLTTASTSVDMPSKLTGGHLYMATFTNTPSGGTAHAAVMVRLQGNPQGAVPTVAMKEPDAASIDTRYDDGSPASGNITTASGSSATSCEASGVYTLGTGSPGTYYCIMMFLVQ